MSDEQPEQPDESEPRPEQRQAELRAAYEANVTYVAEGMGGVTMWESWRSCHLEPCHPRGAQRDAVSEEASDG